MAVKRSTFWHLFHFTARFIGVTGAALAVVGWFLWADLGIESGLVVILGGLSVVALALLAEVRNIARMTGSARGAFGSNVVLQVALLFVLVGGANYYAFHHYKRFDLTQDQRFTLDATLRSQFAQFTDETHIIIYQRYLSFGQRAKAEDKAEALLAKVQQDQIDFAAQRKIIEKVVDLAEQFQDLGPRFHVHVLDLKDESFNAKKAELRALTPDSSELVDTVLAAQENSVFFYSKQNKKIQRLGFNDIYRVDTQASAKQENLVLQYQGEKPFVDKIFNIEEKKPRVATAIVHPYLGFHDKTVAVLTMAGAKKVLDEYGFRSIDLMVRQPGPRRSLSQQPTALTRDESRFEQIEDHVAELERVLVIKQKELDEATPLLKEWRDQTLAELNKKYVYIWRVDGAQGVVTHAMRDKYKNAKFLVKELPCDEDDQKNHIARFQAIVDDAQEMRAKAIKKKEELLKEKATLKVEDLAETRRMTDVEARMKRLLSDVDLLIVPRLTILNAAAGDLIPSEVHKLDPTQLKALKHYISQGKPVLFLVGPSNEPRDDPDKAAPPADGLDSLLGELGFKMPRQTILYDAELEEFNERKREDRFSKSDTEAKVPDLDLETFPTVTWTKKPEAPTPHAIRSSMRLTSRTVMEQVGNDIRIRNPRPIYFVRTEIQPRPAATILGALTLPGFAGPTLAWAAGQSGARYYPNDNMVFLATRREGWNEENPFITEDEKVPSYQPTKDDDRKKGTLEEVRRGPFPIGVAIETTAPAWWVKEGEKPKKTRLAVIGSGGAFVGSDLTPLQGKMLVDVSNWLLGRDDLLAHEADNWSFPRVPLEAGSTPYKLWLGLAAALPLFFIYIGTLVWMTRRLR